MLITIITVMHRFLFVITRINMYSRSQSGVADDNFAPYGFSRFQLLINNQVRIKMIQQMGKIVSHITKAERVLEDLTKKCGH